MWVIVIYQHFQPYFSYIVINRLVEGGQLLHTETPGPWYISENFDI